VVGPSPPRAVSSTVFGEGVGSGLKWVRPTLGLHVAGSLFRVCLRFLRVYTNDFFSRPGRARPDTVLIVSRIRDSGPGFTVQYF